MRPRRPHGPPAWWPEGEAWPPRDFEWRWRRRRARFIGVFGIVASAIWLLSAVGAMTIIGRVFGGDSVPGRHVGVPWPRPGFWLIAVAFIAFVALLRRVASPAGDIVAAAHRVAEGDFSARVPERGSPAVRAVAQAFNDMAERLAKQERQRRELMAEIAHELRTPLSIVQGRIEGLIDGVYPRETSQLEPLLDDTRVLARLVEDLRTLANAESGVLTLDREPTDVGMLLRDAVSAVGAEAAQEGVTISIDDPEPIPPVSVDPVRLRQVVVNLVANAIRHGSRGGAVTVRARATPSALLIEVADNGPGIPAEELPKIFDRFHRRPGSAGSGLGLTIARSLVRAHGGDIRAESSPGRGTTISFTIPLSS